MTVEFGPEPRPDFTTDRARLLSMFTQTCDEDIAIDRGIATDQLAQVARCGGTSEVLLLLHDVANQDPTVALGMVTNLLGRTQHDKDYGEYSELLAFADSLLEADDAKEPADRIFTDHDKLTVYEFMPLAPDPESPFSIHVQQPFGAVSITPRRSGVLGPDEHGLAQIRVIEDMVSVPEIDLQHDRALLKVLKSMLRRGDTLSAFQHLDTTQVRTQSVLYEIDLMHDLLLHRQLCQTEADLGIKSAYNFVNNRPARTDKGRELIDAFFARTRH